MGKAKGVGKKAVQAMPPVFYLETWLHLAVSYDKGNAKVYVNGKLVKEGRGI